MASSTVQMGPRCRLNNLASPPALPPRWLGGSMLSLLPLGRSKAAPLAAPSTSRLDALREGAAAGLGAAGSASAGPSPNGAVSASEAASAPAANA